MANNYALKAFKVNSIDYLLKPLDKEELKNSLAKYRSTRPDDVINVEQIRQVMNEKDKTYQQRFIVSRRDKIMSVKVDQVAYFEGEDRYVYLVKKDGARYIIDYKLGDLEAILHPKHFFRLNRKTIVHVESIQKASPYFNSRLALHLNPPADFQVIVSREKVKAFKEWLGA